MGIYYEQRESDSYVGQEFDLFDEVETMDEDADFALLSEECFPDTMQENDKPAIEGGYVFNEKLETRRRLGAYLERQWFYDHGWDKDDEIFEDDYFSDLTAALNHSS